MSLKIMSLIAFSTGSTSYCTRCKNYLEKLLFICGYSESLKKSKNLTKKKVSHFVTLFSFFYTVLRRWCTEKITDPKNGKSLWNFDKLECHF